MKRVQLFAITLCMAITSAFAQRSYNFNAAALNVDGLPNQDINAILTTVNLNPDGKNEAGATAFCGILANSGWDIVGFSEKFFAQQAMLMDEISYRCLYKQDPIEREGLLYTEDELRYFQTTPDREPDAILAVCDTKSTGTDWMVMPVLEQYGNDYYMVDCLCDDSTNFARQYKRLADKLVVDNAVQQCEFEANAGGSRVAYEVNKLVEGLGRYCNITSKTQLTNKETRIIVAAPFVKEHILFRDKEQYTRRSDYGKFMSFLLGYSIAGRNTHDDVPDAMAAFTNFVQKLNRVRPAVIMESPI